MSWKKQILSTAKLWFFAILAIGSVRSDRAYVRQVFEQNEQEVPDLTRYSNVPIGSGPLKLLLNASSGSYQITVGGAVWLNSAPTYFTANGRQYNATVGGGLQLVGSFQDAGVDNLGPWSSTVLKYQIVTNASKSVEVLTEFRQYDHHPDAVLFAQHFPDGLDGSSISSEASLSSGFPSFHIDSKSALSYLAFGGIMFGDIDKSFGRWIISDVDRIVSGLDSGPLVLFNGLGDATVISAFSNFMAVSSGIYLSQSDSATASWGVLGSATSIPRDFSIWTVISHSSDGVNQAMERWGELLRKKYNRGTAYRDAELTNNYIGYYTDNGAYYYYLTEKGQTYHDTILQVKSNAIKHNIPFRYIQYDSWFYPKGPQFGATEWVSMPEIFPNGMQYTWNKTGWVSVAHNRWWSDKTVYAKENGGKYEFVVEHKTVKKALPVDNEFWNDLLRESRKWGLTVYEQDWINLQFNTMQTVISSVLIGEKWLLLMGEGALKNGVNIQYCMAPSRAAMMSLLIPNVVQGRVSEDYQPGNDQWKIGVSSMFAHALGVAPFKDNFWSTTEQPGNIYNLTEPNPELQSVVSTLSAGPVAPGDKIGYANIELIMRSCNADGLLLKPSRPATAVDMQIYRRATDGFEGEVWTTYSHISGLTFGVILGANFKQTDVFPLWPAQTGFGKNLPFSLVFPWFAPGLKSAQPFTDSNPLVLKDCYLKTFCLYLTSPVIHVGSNEIYLAGELSKWVPMSYRRVVSIERSQSEVTISLQGAANEAVLFTYVINNRIEQAKCILSIDGQAKLQLLAKRCLVN